jgi:2-dehydro-3-deoxyphosphooctonate aldolase (KDO 8-P synthase)
MNIDSMLGNDKKLFAVLGPCQIESESHAFRMCESIKSICDKNNWNFIYKSSFDKANRTSLQGKRGVGLEEGLKIFEKLKKEFDVSVVTDIHTAEQCGPVAEVVDMLQIPAFLSRQTDLLLAAGRTNKWINLKKGQFMAPWDIKHSAEKIASTGNNKIMLCERGVSFGYNTLVTDMRSLYEMKKTGYPVCLDATHSCQQPGGQGTTSGGNREHIPVIAQAGVAVGVASIFMEVHNNPDQAYSDGPNNLNLKDLEPLLRKLHDIDSIIKH